MRACLVGLHRLSDDPRALALVHGLRSVGHDVHVVAGGSGPARAGDVEVERIPAARRRSALEAMRRRLRGRATLLADHRRRIRAAVEAAVPDVVYPTHPEAVALAEAAARACGAVVVTPPDWDASPDVAAAWRVPADPALAPGSGGQMPALHTGPPANPGTRPREGRHRGRRLAVAYRRHERSPGRYVEAALGRAGVEVVAVEGRLDWDRLPDVEAVLIVESPLPQLEVEGRRRPVPVLFWVHHGEHHLALNLRLVARYGVDVVLLAHSWHLAHRFPVPVERWPFAIASELFARGGPLPARSLDVAFVGSHVDGGGAYGRRYAMLQRVREVVDPTRLAIVDGVSPAEVAALYANARIVLNEGGRRHRPITMRVFEAIGSGAMLATEPTPGLDVLVPRGSTAEFGDGDGSDAHAPDVGTVVADLLDDPAALAASADVAATLAWEHHTYDHRVDELLAVIDRSRDGRGRPAVAPAAQDGLAALVDADPEVQRVVSDVAPALREALPDREIWDLDRVADRLRPGGYEAVALEDVPPDLDRVVAAAWRYGYAGPRAADAVVAAFGRIAPDAQAERGADGSVRIDLDPASYRLPRSSPAGDDRRP